MKQPPENIHVSLKYKKINRFSTDYTQPYPQFVDKIILKKAQLLI